MRFPLLCLALIPLADDPPGGLLVFDRGDQLGFTVPDDERLEFEVMLDMALVGETAVGTFVLSAGTEEHRSGIASQQPGKTTGKRVGWIRGKASGSALNYTLDHTIETRILPQDWPRVIYRDVQAGSEHRKREIMYGEREDKPTSWYRSDGHCGGCERPEHMLEGTWPFSTDRHCGGCKRGEHRLWSKPTTQEIPAHAVDMLCAIHLARAMVRQDIETLQFALLDKESHWDVTLTRARTRSVATSAGTFRCVEVKFDPVLPKEKKEGRFRGLFGIHGSLSIWLEEDSGVPVEIEGIIPVGPFDIGVALRLERFRGTPQAFTPLGE